MQQTISGSVEQINARDAANESKSGHFIVEQIDWVIPRKRQKLEKGHKSLSRETGKHEDYWLVVPR